MRAAVFRGARDLRIEDDWPEPHAGPGEVVVRVTAAGVCGSDAAEFDRKLYTRPGADGLRPVVLGHEFAGEVVGVGSGVQLPRVGSAVVCGAGISCGACDRCAQGRTNLCTTYHTVGFARDGGLAEYCAVPASILVDATAWGLGTDTLGLGQPMAIAVHAVRRSGLLPNQLAVVVGVGGIGAFLTYAASQAGAEVWVCDVAAQRLDLGLTLGAARGIGTDRSLADELATEGRRADVFFEVSGTPSGLASVLMAASPGATIVPVGVQKPDPTVPLGAWTLREYDVVGTVAHVCSVDLPRAIDVLATRASGWDDITGDILGLDQLVPDGLAPLAAGAPRAVKTLIDPRLSLPRPSNHVVRQPA